MEGNGRPHLPSRQSLIGDLAVQIASLKLLQPVRVAVDGRCGSGKTFFADELAEAIGVLQRSVIRASVDSFHHPAAVRYKQGRYSADGYYEDARDIGALRELLLDPLGPSGNRLYATASFDLERDRSLQPDIREAVADSICIVDGTFLQRAELRSAWDFVVFLSVSEDEARRRAVVRDSRASNDAKEAEELYVKRYDAAFRRYDLECNPTARADVVIDNTDFAEPVLLAH